MTGVGDYAGKISADYYITHDTSGTPDGYLPAPKFNPVGCSFTDKITVTITGAEGADIFYTVRWNIADHEVEKVRRSDRDYGNDHAVGSIDQ